MKWGNQNVVLAHKGSVKTEKQKSFITWYIKIIIPPDDKLLLQY